jgi:hypothetical protein
MQLTIEQERYLLERRRQIESEIRRLEGRRGPHYDDPNDKRVELLDELNRIEAELRGISGA